MSKPARKPKAPAPAPPKRGDKVSDEHGELTCMESVDGWVVCRRKGCAPCLMTVREWDKLRGEQTR